MIRWFIAAYIVVVLVLSAKATARTSLDSNPAINKFNYQSIKNDMLNVQDPLPNINIEVLRPVNLDSNSENSVG